MRGKFCGGEVGRDGRLYSRRKAAAGAWSVSSLEIGGVKKEGKG
jgi:hypothetical protein